MATSQFQSVAEIDDRFFVVVRHDELVFLGGRSSLRLVCRLQWLQVLEIPYL